MGAALPVLPELFTGFGVNERRAVCVGEGNGIGREDTEVVLVGGESEEFGAVRSETEVRGLDGGPVGREPFSKCQ